MKKLFIFLLLGFLLLSLFGYFCAYKRLAPKIEADIKNRVKNSLLRNNLATVQVETNGRDITLKGEVGSEELKAKALRVAAIDGYHTIVNNIVVAQASVALKSSFEPYFLLIKLKKNQSILLRGFVPDMPLKNTLLSVANSRYGKSHVTDHLSIKSNSPLHWQEILMTALNSLPDLQQAQIKVSNNKFELRGFADSEESRQKIAIYLENNLPKNYTGRLDIGIIPTNEGVK